MSGASQDIDEVRRIVLAGLRGWRARVYLFGSHARGSASAISDIDVAVEALELLPPGLLAQIHEVLDESTVLRRVDLVDVARTSAEFRHRVREEGIPWTV